MKENSVNADLPLLRTTRTSKLLVAPFIYLTSIFVPVFGLMPQLRAVSFTQTADFHLVADSPFFVSPTASAETVWQFAGFNPALGILTSVDFTASDHTQVNSGVAIQGSTQVIDRRTTHTSSLVFGPGVGAIDGANPYSASTSAGTVTVPPNGMYSYTGIYDFSWAQSFNTASALAAFSAPNSLSIRTTGSGNTGGSRGNPGGSRVTSDYHLSITYNYSPASASVPEESATWILFASALGGLLAVSGVLRKKPGV